MSTSPYKEMRESHGSVLDFLARQPGPVTIPSLTKALSAHLGRTIISVPYDPASIQMPTCNHSQMTGLWVHIEEPQPPHDTRDLVFYPASEDYPPPLQLGCWGHEIGHVLMDDPTQAEQRLEQLAHVLAPTLLEFGGMELIHSLRARTSDYSDVQEQRAEAFGVLVVARMLPRIATATSSGLIGSLGSPLLNPFRAGRA